MNNFLDFMQLILSLVLVWAPLLGPAEKLQVTYRGAIFDRM